MSGREPLEDPDVVGDVGPEDDRELGVAPSSRALAGAFTRERQREVGVVIGRVELHRLRELTPSASRIDAFSGSSSFALESSITA